MYDVLDILHGQSEYYMQGAYYGAVLENPSPFFYAPVDRKSWTFRKLFANMQNSDTATFAIKTDDDLNAKVGDYVSLQDGGLYQIQSVEQDFASGNKEVYRFLKDAPHCDFYIVLVEVDDNWTLTGQ